MKDFFIYLKSPFLVEIPTKIEWGNFFSLFILYIIIMLPVGSVVKIVNHILNISQVSIESSIYLKILIALIIAPVLEEFLFRLILIINRKNVIIFSATSLILCIISCLRSHFFNSIILLLISLLGILALYKLPFLVKVTKKHFSIFFYFIAFTFGFFHVFNYVGISGFKYLWVPFLGLPQIIMGVFFGYTRLKYGIAYSILFHMIINLLALSSL